jgi:RNA polymerase sigma-70 factor, ECF subfamily
MATLRRGRADSDEALIRLLYDEHGGAMMAYAVHLTRDRAAAEDAVQEALIRAWKHLDTLNDREGSVRGWLLKVTRNIIIDAARAKKVRPREVAETDWQGAVTADHANGVVDSMVVIDGLQQLSAAHREVLEQMYLRGLSVNETAETLGIPAGTVKSRSYYGLRALQAWFAQASPMAREGAWS